MSDNAEFETTLQVMLNKKQDWFNNTFLQEMLQQYRLVHTCVRNLYDVLVKKSLINQDPYRLDKRISDITVPDTSVFPESDNATQLGSRFSDYETMLDYICTYFRFTVDNITIPTTKKLFDFNASFDWKNLSPNCTQSNTRALATVLNQAKINTPSVLVSMINDCCVKSSEAITTINSMLNELVVFEKELYKGQIRSDLFNHPEFNRQKASESAEAELSEIKRLYTKVMGKRAFYNDLISEIISEDHNPDKDKLRANILKRLEIKGAVQEKKKKEAPDPKAMLIEAVCSLGSMAPTLQQIIPKLQNNFDLLFAPKKGFMTFLRVILKQLFKLKDKERICEVPVKDAKTGTETKRKIVVSDLLTDINQRVRIYNGIGNRGVEFEKIKGSTEEAILSFMNKQISDIQSIFTTVNALDSYFKSAIEITERPKIKGMQIELSALRNSIINANKKRGEYISYKEESIQMRKLGITDD